MKLFYYIEPKKPEDRYALVGNSKWSEANSQFEFSELGFCKDDDFYHLFAHATSFTGIEKFGERNWNFQPQLIKMKVARKNYQKEDKEKNKVDVEQSRLEKWICSILDNTDPAQFYSGFIKLEDSPMCGYFLTGLGVDGKPMEAGTIAALLSMNVQLLPLFDPPVYIKPEDVQAPNSKGGWGGKGGYGGGKTQTELERLKDRLAFICEQVNECGIEPPVRNLPDILRAVKTSTEREIISDTLSWLTTLFS